MAEAELRRETAKMFKDMGMSHLPDDTLDFFQRNLENEGGESTDWKKGLLGPSSRPRRTSSDGNALVHLKKKYATGLNPDYHSKRNAAIAAVTQQAADTTTNSSENSKEKLRTRHLSPASGLKGRFGYSGPVSSRPKVNSPAENSKQPEVDGSSDKASPPTDSTVRVREVEMLKRRIPKPKAAASPDSVIDSNKEAPSRRLVHTSSAGSVLKQPSAVPQSRGQATGFESNINSSISRRYGSTKEPSASVVNGVHHSMPPSGIQAPAANVHSYKSPMTTSSNTSSPSSSGISTIDSIKLSSVNMRSLTKAQVPTTVLAERKVPAERKVSVEKKVSAERKVSLERRYSSERRMSDTEKPSGIPVPAQVSKTPTSAASKVGNGSGEDANTHVVFSRKSSFKVLNVSSTSHRILHTVQDGGAPKRQNSITRGVRPISILTSGGSGQQDTSTTTKPPLLTRQTQESPKQPPPPRSSGQDSSGSSNLLVTHSTSVEESRIQASAKTPGQNKKDGVYDRLAEKERPITMNIEPVYETIDDRHRTLPSPVSAAKDGKDGGAPKTTGSLKIERIGGEKRTLGLSKETSSSMPANSQNLSSVGTTPSRAVQTVKLQGSNIGQSTSNSREGGGHFEPVAEPPGETESDKSVQSSSIMRYSTESGAIYSMVNTKKGPLAMQTQETGGGRNGGSGQGKDSQNLERSTGGPVKGNHLAAKPAPHRALSSSLSDTSSDSWQPRVQDSATSESDMEPRPSALSDNEDKMARLKVGGGEGEEILDPEKRQAMLEINWSHQSLDKNMREVATSTVAALSTLVEVLTTPAHDSVDKKFQFDDER